MQSKLITQKDSKALRNTSDISHHNLIPFHPFYRLINLKRIILL